MAQIRDTIEALCIVLNNHCPNKLCAESFRQAKFDKDEATETLWLTLHTVLCTESLKPTDICNHGVVNLCKHKMFQKGYRVNDFFRLPEDMSCGSRELMLALGWLMAKQDVVTTFINKLEPLISEDPPMDLTLYGEIPLPAAPDGFTETVTQTDSKTSVDVAECLILKYHKLNSSLKSLLAARNAYTKIVCKLHSILKASKSQSSSHFSSQDVYLLRHPQELTKYQEKLEWFCTYTKALVLWSVNEQTFWKWMESVLDAKFLRGTETEHGIYCPQKHLFKPSRTLQKAKQHQVQLSQMLNAQEPVYRKVSKRWKKIKANLQQSLEERHENISEVLSLLDSQLLSEIRELQKDFRNSQGKCRDLKTNAAAVCFKKLIQADTKRGSSSKEVVNKSVASEEIDRLTQEKQALEAKLRSLKEEHKAKLFHIFQTHPNLVCISPDLTGSTL